MRLIQKVGVSGATEVTCTLVDFRYYVHFVLRLVALLALFPDRRMALILDIHGCGGIGCVVIWSCHPLLPILKPYIQLILVQISLLPNFGRDL